MKTLAALAFLSVFLIYRKSDGQAVGVSPVDVSSALTTDLAQVDVSSTTPAGDAFVVQQIQNAGLPNIKVVNGQVLAPSVQVLPAPIMGVVPK